METMPRQRFEDYLKEFREAKVLSNKTRDKIAELSAKPLTDQLKPIAYEHVVGSFCLPRCGETPDGELCPAAKEAHQLFVALLFRFYSGLN